MKNSDAIQAGLVLASGVVMATAGGALRGAAGTADPMDAVDAVEIEGVLGMALSTLGVAIIAFWLLALGVGVLAELLRRRGPSAAATFAHRCTPAVMRRLAATLLGVNLLALPAVAQAAGGPEAGGAAPVVAGWLAPDSRALPGAGPYTAAGPGDPGSTAGPGDPGTTAGPGDPGTSAGPGDPAPAGSTYWSPMALPVGPDEGGVGPGTPQSSPVPGCPVSPAWEPAPLPTGGGLLIRAETRTTAGTADVVVTPGDSLWSIVASRLGPLATAADVAEAWPAWYDTNRATIGEDPSLLVPGQILRSPSP